MIELTPDLFIFYQVADPRQVTILSRKVGQEPKRFTVRHEVDIPVQVPDSAGEGQLEASVIGPDQQSVPSTVTKEDDGYHHIRFVPRQTGLHKVRVMYGGKEVSGSPYDVKIRDSTSMKVKVQEMEQMRTGYATRKEVWESSLYNSINSSGPEEDYGARIPPYQKFPVSVAAVDLTIKIFRLCPV